MRYDAIVIGAGFGGLSCAAKLAKNGQKVLLLEKNPHIGGTSYIFYRSGYTFPMGALGFSYPGKVKEFLQSVGIQEEIIFKQSHYRLITPYFDMVYSRPIDEFKKDLKHMYPAEKGIDAFFAEMGNIIDLVENISSWHPRYLVDRRKIEALQKKDPDLPSKLKRVEGYARMPSAAMLDKYFTDPILINFLGSQGTYAPSMSVLNLALMWNIISRQGIWFPSCGIHGLTDRLEESFRRYGGELKTSCPVKKILVSQEKARGVLCENDHTYLSDWVVSNTDYKKTFLQLIEKNILTSQYLKFVEKSPYTQSELCVYLGINPQNVNLDAMTVPHLFFKHKYDWEKLPDLEDFDNREMEICLWSDKAPQLIPPGKAALILRIGFPYGHFSRFWTGEKKRKQGYKSYKKRLALSLVKTADHILPGLLSAVEVMEVATPLTYQDWGQRHLGSLAGWTWTVKDEEFFDKKILVKTPISNIFMAGIYAASELFLGGIPTAIHTGSMAADVILRKTINKH
jgi:all-trans-retinol 13,14-reductase